jgi:hypothetical protein
MEPLPKKAAALVAAPYHGNAQRRTDTRREKVVVIKIAMDQIEGMLAQVFSQRRTV